MYRYALLSTLCLVASPLNAGEVKEIEASSIELGGFRGIVYYTREGDGYHVVTTIAEGDTGSPLRFEATLNEGQKITISIPGKIGEPSRIIDVVRSNHKLIVGPQGATEAVIVAHP
jgi:hypothetical protein